LKLKLTLSVIKRNLDGFLKDQKDIKNLKAKVYNRLARRVSIATAQGIALGRI
jgi:hypothetical protein